MMIASGTKLGPYEIVALLGAVTGPFEWGERMQRIAWLPAAALAIAAATAQGQIVGGRAYTGF